MWGITVSAYSIPEVITPEPVAQNEVMLVANSDLRQSAIEICWAGLVGMLNLNGGLHKAGIPFSRSEAGNNQY